MCISLFRCAEDNRDKSYVKRKNVVDSKVFSYMICTSKQGDTHMQAIHWELGEMNVELYVDATYWMGHNVYFCPEDPELGSFHEEELEWIS